MKNKIRAFLITTGALFTLLLLLIVTILMVIGEILVSMWETLRYGDSSYTTRKVMAFRGDYVNKTTKDVLKQA